jgi:hypothetical protein
VDGTQRGAGGFAAVVGGAFFFGFFTSRRPLSLFPIEVDCHRLLGGARGKASRSREGGRCQVGARRSWVGEAGELCCIDGLGECLYIRNVPVRKIQVGQVWKQDESGDSYLITKVYNEALTTYVVLRKTGAESERPVKVKVDNRGTTQTLPGYSYALESDDF